MTKDSKAARRGALALGLVCAALASATASAQMRNWHDQLFERFDADRNGVIERRELDDARRAAFERADADRDGYVTAEEAKALREEAGMSERARRARPGMPSRHGAGEGDVLARLDTDGDGRVSAVEYVEVESPLLRRLDADRDGRITREEAARAQPRAAGARRGRWLL